MWRSNDTPTSQPSPPDNTPPPELLRRQMKLRVFVDDVQQSVFKIKGAMVATGNRKSSWLTERLNDGHRDIRIDLLYFEPKVFEILLNCLRQEQVHVYKLISFEVSPILYKLAKEFGVDAVWKELKWEVALHGLGMNMLGSVLPTYLTIAQTCGVFCEATSCFSVHQLVGFFRVFRVTSPVIVSLVQSLTAEWIVRILEEHAEGGWLLESKPGRGQLFVRDRILIIHCWIQHNRMQTDEALFRRLTSRTIIPRLFNQYIPPKVLRALVTWEREIVGNSQSGDGLTDFRKVCMEYLAYKCSYYGPVRYKGVNKEMDLYYLNRSTSLEAIKDRHGLVRLPEFILLPLLKYDPKSCVYYREYV